MKKLLLPLVALLITPQSWAQITLEVDAAVRVLGIDGKAQGVGIFKPVHQRLVLGDGAHQLQVRYEDLFDKGADDHEVVRSGPSLFEVPAGLPAGTYRLTLQNPPTTLAQAQKYRKQPVFVLQAGQQVVAQVQGENRPEPGLVDRINQTLSGAVNAEVRAITPAESRSNLFKQLWNSATADERRAMLEWAKAHP